MGQGSITYRGDDLINCRESSLRTILEELAMANLSNTVASLVSHWREEAGWRPPGTLDLDFDAQLATEDAALELAGELEELSRRLTSDGKTDSSYLAGVIARFLRSGYEGIDPIHRPSKA